MFVEAGANPLLDYEGSPRLLPPNPLPPILIPPCTQPDSLISVSVVEYSGRTRWRAPIRAALTDDANESRKFAPVGRPGELWAWGPHQLNGRDEHREKPHPTTTPHPHHPATPPHPHHPATPHSPHYSPPLPHSPRYSHSHRISQSVLHAAHLSHPRPPELRIRTS
ncbi:hypothetical protein Pcinc_033797 [Petrolisthes cinctipes]|uniref:Uncharacterized protein n=1 Tax=Petrolisthes cinctipes TaxID=88211 RepID=A0AAE1ERN9_PETCI|nr:hypothetical protein Pcinc_033797 [Petrolisthes cinctipes]